MVLCLFTFERKNVLKTSLVDFPLGDSALFATDFGFSLEVVGLADLPLSSTLTSSFGSSGGGGGGINIPLEAAEGSDTCATLGERHRVSLQTWGKHALSAPTS